MEREGGNRESNYKASRPWPWPMTKGSYNFCFTHFLSTNQKLQLMLQITNCKLQRTNYKASKVLQDRWPCKSTIFKLFSNHNGCFLESFNAKSGLCSVFSVQCSVLGVQCSLFRWRLFQYLRTLNCGALTPSVVSWWTKGRYVPSDDVSVFWFVRATGARVDMAVLGISSNPIMTWIPLSHIVVEAE